MTIPSVSQPVGPHFHATWGHHGHLVAMAGDSLRTRRRTVAGSTHYTRLRI
ncbi:hypothetical protein [Novacetimonas maltaceti]|uniref:hypothetical protein n=1 Tax=Novacetimonas maltaceti TaxID=1203393 RepID=UPI00142E52D8|nr:hypothetical protein [Novacetimonas maltaceti]